MDSAKYQALMELFEAATELAGVEQDAFIAEVRVKTPDLVDPLIELLAADRISEKKSFLTGVDYLDGDPATSPGASSDIEASQSAALDRFLFQPGAMIGQYELIRPLGQGGTSAVFLARDVRLGRRVAIKLLTHDGLSLPAERFWAEARVTALCKHENIVVIYDVGEVESYAYMVLEYVRGVTLRAWLKERWGAGAKRLATHVRPLVSVSQAVELILPVVRALVHAHGLGMVHRDLKPENIMLADDGPLKVLDFGIAKVVERSGVTRPVDAGPPLMSPVETGVGGMLGTLPYMAPEQWGQGTIDERTDLWAVGIILFEIITGQHPLQPVTMARLATVTQPEVPMPSVRDLRPDIGPLSDVIDRCLQKDKSARIVSAEALLQALAPLLARRRADSGAGRKRFAESSAHPFAGLAAFQEMDENRFFGRDRDLAVMLAKLRHHSMVTVIGPSGAGKSSFIRAGVIPALKRTRLGTEAFVLRPGRNPLVRLADVLAQMAEEDDEMPEVDTQTARLEALKTQPGYLGTVLRRRCRRQQGQIVLFIDQFEELYTLGTDRATRQAFVHCIEGIADDASSPLRVMLSLRSDFLDRVAEDQAFTSEILRGLMLLGPMGRSELQAALTSPVEAVGYAFESEGLVAAMLDALETTKAPLPLLQFTAAALWDDRYQNRRRITEASYRKLGGVAGALAAHADTVLAGLSTLEQRAARFVFTHLVTEERTRALSSVSELQADAPVTLQDAVEPVTLRLADARLVLIETDAGRGRVVELSHESLIDRWPTLQQWLGEDQEQAHFRARLRVAATAWDKQGRSTDLLWRGQAAQDAQRWLDRGTLDEEAAGLGSRDRAYLHAIVEHANRARRRKRRAGWGAFVALAAVVVVVSIMALFARSEAEKADAQAAFAVEQAQRARVESVIARNASRMAAAREHMSDPTLVLALVREIEPSHPPPRWAELAQWALQQGVAQAVLRHPHPVLFASFSPDGDRVVTASVDKRVRIFSKDASEAPVILRGHEDAVYSASFSPDGRRVATASWDRTVRIVSADGTGTPMVLRDHTDAVFSASFSPDGNRLVTASADHTARIAWLNEAKPPVVLRGHTGTVYFASFSPDGTRVVTASADRTARVYDAETGEVRKVLQGHEQDVVSAMFSPDGRSVVTASWDKRARLYDLNAPETPLILRGSQQLVTWAAFHPDGTRIVTASADKMVRVYRTGATEPYLQLKGHQLQVNSVSFSADGTRVLTASGDGTVRVFDVKQTGRPRVLGGHRDTVYAAAFSPDGKRVVTASVDKTVRVHTVNGASPPVVLSGHDDAVWSAAFDVTGTRIVTASADHTARIFAADGQGTPVVLRGHTDVVYLASFSPDGDYVATASRDGTARIFASTGAGAGLVLSGHDDAVYAASFSPDGRQIVTASRDGTARVFRTDGLGVPTVLRGHKDALTSAAFTPDGRRVVTASWDKTVRVHDLDGHAEAKILTGHEGAVSLGRPGGVFDPAGTAVLTVSEDKTIRLWDLRSLKARFILRPPEIDAWSVALSSDGRRLVSASHAQRLVSSSDKKRLEYGAWVWTDIAPLTDLNDARLWAATTYCPSIDRRQALLGMRAPTAEKHRADCRQRVAQTRW